MVKLSRCDGMVDVTDSKSVGGDTVWVRVPPPAPNNDNPNYIIQVGNVFGFIISIENVL